MRTYTDDDLSALKAKHRIPYVLECTVPGFGPLPLAPFAPLSFSRWVDENIKDAASSNDAALVRHVLFYSPAEVNAIRRQVANVAQLVVDCLAGDAGLPVEVPARSQIDDFSADTPPGVLALAGLDEAQADKLLADLDDDKAKIITVLGVEGERVFACVLRAPGDAERNVLDRAKAAAKGYADACRSAVDGCLVWSSMPLADCWREHPAIPVLVLAPVISDLGGSGAERRFRRR